MKRRKIAILGATGLVGQRLVAMLGDHPFFKISELVGDDSAGKIYAAVVDWRLPKPIPNGLAFMEVVRLQPSKIDADLILSALPASVAATVEPQLAQKGFPIVSDTSAHRMAERVPLIVPEVNPDHLQLVEEQKSADGSSGFIVTNPNCSTSILSLALKPLDDAYGLEAVSVVTMQALSGAGLPGVSAIAIQDNIIPYIAQEEEKIERESRKILGSIKKGRISEKQMAISASCHRVPVTHGHLESVQVKTSNPINPVEAQEVLSEFAGAPQRLNLPSAPEKPVLVRNEPDRPQPVLDRDAGTIPGMSIVVGRLRQGADRFSLRFDALGHNLIRGAAGQTLLTAELLVAEGRLEGG